MKKKSEFGKINSVDLLNALYHATAAVSLPLLGFLSIGRLPTLSECYMMISVFLGAFLADVFKRNYTNSNGELLRKTK